MAIRNVDLGGATDWVDGNILESLDLNDTFDAASSKVKTLTSFWLNSDLYDVYDDFESYTAGAFAGNAKWGISLGTNSSSTIVSSTNAGGSGKELKVTAQKQDYGEATITSTITFNFTANKHHHLKISWNPILESGSGASSGTAQASLIVGETIVNFWRVSTRSGSATENYNKTNILIIAKGSSEYDVYVGGTQIYNNTTLTSLSIIVNAKNNTATNNPTITSNIYIDDVYQSKESV